MQSKLKALLVCAAFAGSAGNATALPYVVTDLAAFRTGPGLEFLPAFAIPPRAIVDVRNCHRGWCQATYNGASGFIAFSLLAKPVVVDVVTTIPAAVVPAPVVVAAPVPVVTRVVAPVVAPVVTPVVTTVVTPLPVARVGFITVPLPITYY